MPLEHARIDRAGRREVAAEERRVDDDPAHDAGDAETNDAEVVTGDATAPRLPPVHPLAAIGVLPLAPDRLRRFEQVLLRREELVVRVEDRAAETLLGEIDEAL